MANPQPIELVEPEIRPYEVTWVMRGTTVVHGRTPEEAQLVFDTLAGGYGRLAQDAYEVEPTDVKPRST